MNTQCVEHDAGQKVKVLRFDLYKLTDGRNSSSDRRFRLTVSVNELLHLSYTWMLIIRGMGDEQICFFIYILDFFRDLISLA